MAGSARPTRLMQSRGNLGYDSFFATEVTEHTEENLLLLVAHPECPSFYHEIDGAFHVGAASAANIRSVWAIFRG